MNTTDCARMRTEVGEVGRSLVLRVVGEFDAATAPSLDCLLHALLDAEAEADVIVDVSEVTAATEDAIAFFESWTRHLEADLRVREEDPSMYLG